jgi:hypothetical protein
MKPSRGLRAPITSHFMEFGKLVGFVSMKLLVDFDKYLPDVVLFGAKLLNTFVKHVLHFI